MPNKNVTIRHARSAIYMVLNGAVRDIESEYESAENPECKEAIKELFDEVADEIDQWEIAGTQANKLSDLLSEMQNGAIAEGAPGRELVLALLVNHDLLP
jgi:hypothetical protein